MYTHKNNEIHLSELNSVRREKLLDHKRLSNENIESCHI